MCRTDWRAAKARDLIGDPRSGSSASPGGRRQIACRCSGNTTLARAEKGWVYFTVFVTAGKSSLCRTNVSECRSARFTVKQYVPPAASALRKRGTHRLPRPVSLCRPPEEAYHQQTRSLAALQLPPFIQDPGIEDEAPAANPSYRIAHSCRCPQQADRDGPSRRRASQCLVDSNINLPGGIDPTVGNDIGLPAALGFVAASSIA